MANGFQFHWRRIPGTLALAFTNLIAGALLFFKDDFGKNIFTAVPTIGTTSLWGTLFFTTAFTLMAAAIFRRWILLNIGSGLSLFVWTFVCLSIFGSWLVGDVHLSPIIVALLFWMLFGQVTMLFAPLWARGRGNE